MGVLAKVVALPYGISDILDVSDVNYTKGVASAPYGVLDLSAFKE